MDKTKRRIFVAINLPNKLKKQVGEYSEELKASFPEDFQDAVAKWVDSKNLHITLYFLGEIKDDLLPKAIRAVEKSCLGWNKFVVELSNISYGPGNKIPPHFIWISIKKNMDLACIANNLGKNFVEEKVLREDGEMPFSGHITLARIKEWVWKRIEEDERPEIGTELNLSFEAESIDIIESKLTRQGPEYTILKSIKLS